MLTIELAGPAYGKLGVGRLDQMTGKTVWDTLKGDCVTWGGLCDLGQLTFSCKSFIFQLEKPSCPCDSQEDDSDLSRWSLALPATVTGSETSLWTEIRLLSLCASGSKGLELRWIHKETMKRA